jgi:hypothetical protein
MGAKITISVISVNTQNVSSVLLPIQITLEDVLCRKYVTKFGLICEVCILEEFVKYAKNT